MTTLSKDEVVKMAREAGAVFDPQWGIASNTGTATFERFATLCRAPLVAEVERLKEVWLEDSVRASEDRGNLLKERDDWKARALKAEQVGEPVAWRKKSANGEWVLYYQNVGWKDLSGFEPLYPIQKSTVKVVLTENQTEELIEDMRNTHGLSGDLEEFVSIVVEFINEAAK